MIAILLLVYGAVAAWLGHTVGTRSARVIGLLAAHRFALQMWRREIDRPVASSRAAVRKKLARLRAHQRLASAVLREAKRESEAVR